jgi:hypothetical protein
VIELEAEVGAIAQALADAGEPDWAHMLRSTLEHSPEAERLTYMGHGVALLLERGQRAKEPLATGADGIRQVLVDIVAKWPPAAR